MKGNHMFGIIAMIIYCELLWWAVKSDKVKLSIDTSKVEMLRLLIRTVIWLNIILMITVSIAPTSNFITVYILTFYYYLIYPFRMHELKSEEKGENST